jgi:hypothetical protein
MSLLTETREAAQFILRPSLPDILLNVDRFGSALIAPPVIEEPPPPGFVRQYPPTYQPTAVDHRKALTEQLVDWQNQLVQVRLQLETRTLQLRAEMDGRAAAEKRAKEIELQLVAVRAQLEQKTEELSTALHTIEQIGRPTVPVVSPAVAS